MDIETTNNTVFRSKTTETAAKTEVLPEGKEASHAGTTTDVEVPYLDYKRSNAKPYLVEYFGLGDSWEDPVGGFPEEIGLLEKYLEDKIDSGEYANTISSVKEVLKGIERTNNLLKEERAVIRIGVMSAYVKFLMEKDSIKAGLIKYGRKWNN